MKPHTTNHTSKQHTCEICEKPISHQDALKLQGLDYTVCQSAMCKQVMGQKAVMAPQIFSAFVEFQKTTIKKKRQAEAERAEQIVQITEQEQKEHQAIYENFLQEHPDIKSSELHLMVIPTGASAQAPSGDERLETYKQHLQNIIEEASGYEDASKIKTDEHSEAYEKNRAVERQLSSNEALRSISDQLCTQCKGGCCAAGKDHGYLSVVSMRRQLDKQPELTVDGLYELYASYLNTDIIENSCINQTKTGCALPRELRSDICNAYYCEALKSYQYEMADKDRPRPVLAIQRSHTYWNRFEPGVSNKIVDVVLIDDEPQQADSNIASD